MHGGKSFSAPDDGVLMKIDVLLKGVTYDATGRVGVDWVYGAQQREEIKKRVSQWERKRAIKKDEP